MARTFANMLGGMGTEDRPEAGLIEVARKRLAMSQNEAARRSGISGTRWRQIISGKASVGDGVTIDVRAPAHTLARMAEAVSVSPEQLDGAGRSDAAEDLREREATRGANGGGQDDEEPITRGELKEVLRTLADPEADLSENAKRALRFLEERERDVDRSDAG